MLPIQTFTRSSAACARHSAYNCVSSCMLDRVKLTWKMHQSAVCSHLLNDLLQLAESSVPVRSLTFLQTRRPTFPGYLPGPMQQIPVLLRTVRPHHTDIEQPCHYLGLKLSCTQPACLPG